MSIFFDTNVLVYAVSVDPRAGRARLLLERGGVISAQVLNEFTNVLRKKLRQDWPTVERAIGVVTPLLEPARPLTLETHAAAVLLARDHRLPFYDALIVASAIEARCATLLTEDMQDGRRIGALTIRNPFT